MLYARFSRDPKGLDTRQLDAKLGAPDTIARLKLLFPKTPLTWSCPGKSFIPKKMPWNARLP